MLTCVLGLPGDIPVLDRVRALWWPSDRSEHQNFNFHIIIERIHVPMYVVEDMKLVGELMWYSHPMSQCIFGLTDIVLIY